MTEQDQTSNIAADDAPDTGENVTGARARPPGEHRAVNLTRYRSGDATGYAPAGPGSCQRSRASRTFRRQNHGPAGAGNATARSARPRAYLAEATHAQPADAAAAISLDREVCLKAEDASIRYPYHVRSGPGGWDEFTDTLSGLRADRFLLVTDGGVPAVALDAITPCLQQLAPVTLLRVPAREKDKNIGTIERLAREALRDGATRRSVVVAFGGGLAGNMAGLLAHMFLRGIRLVHVPTTLLAMSDSVLSLKQAVNTGSGKNQLGAFHVPELVWIQLDLASTLPPQQVRAALGEAIKNVVAICPEHYDEMSARLRASAEYSLPELTWFIEMCVAAKQRVMEADPYEKGPALALEYGHTVGHAAEHLSGGSMPHGLAIGVGGLVAARIATLLGHLDPAVEAAHQHLLERNGAPTTFPPGLTVPALMETVRKDNKRGYLPPRRGYVDMVLLDGLGRPRRSGGSIITQVPEDVVITGIQTRLSHEEHAK
jgi:3-dehydroquinate synthase/2-deoxy-scyllo-inosose synthase